MLAALLPVFAKVAGPADSMSRSSALSGASVSLAGMHRNRLVLPWAIPSSSPEVDPAVDLAVVLFAAGVQASSPSPAAMKARRRSTSGSVARRPDRRAPRFRGAWRVSRAWNHRLGEPRVVRAARALGLFLALRSVAGPVLRAIAVPVVAILPMAACHLPRLLGTRAPSSSLVAVAGSRWSPSRGLIRLLDRVVRRSDVAGEAIAEPRPHEVTVIRSLTIVGRGRHGGRFHLHPVGPGRRGRRGVPSMARTGSGFVPATDAGRGTVAPASRHPQRGESSASCLRTDRLRARGIAQSKGRRRSAG